MKNLCSADLRTAVVFGLAMTTPDDVGGQTVVFTETLNAFCKVEDISEREEYKTQSRRARGTYKMTMRYTQLITSMMEVRWRGKIGRVVGRPQNVEERDTWLILKVEENDDA